MSSPEIVSSIYPATEAAPCHAWHGDSTQLQYCGCLQSPALPGSKEVLSWTFLIRNFGFKVSERGWGGGRKLIINLIPAS